MKCKIVGATCWQNNFKQTNYALYVEEVLSENSKKDFFGYFPIKVIIKGEVLASALDVEEFQKLIKSHVKFSKELNERIFLIDAREFNGTNFADSIYDITGLA